MHLVPWQRALEVAADPEKTSVGALHDTYSLLGAGYQQYSPPKPSVSFEQASNLTRIGGDRCLRALWMGGAREQRRRVRHAGELRARAVERGVGSDRMDA